MFLSDHSCFELAICVNKRCFLVELVPKKLMVSIMLLVVEAGNDDWVTGAKP